MLRFLSYNHPFTLAALLLFSVVLRLPSFHSGYFSTDESFYMVSAERIVDGGVQYTDTWDNKPPLIAWFYSIFVFAFGGGALTAIRIFACIYLFACAVLLNQLVIRNRLLDTYPLLPGFISLLLCAVPWYAQELNAEMLMLLPAIGAFYLIYNVSEDHHRNHYRLLLAGILLGICVMIKYQAIFLFILFLIGHAIINTPRFSEYFSMLSGFFISVFAVFLGIYFSGALADWWDIGIVYNLDYLSIGKNPGEEVSLWFNLQQYAKLWGVLILLGLVGLAWFRLNYFTLAIRLRRLEAMFFIWFIGALLTIAAGMGRLYLHYFIAIVPPLSVYIAAFFEKRVRSWVKLFYFLIAMAGPAYTTGVFLSSAFPKTFSFADKYFQPMDWVNGLRKQLNEPHPLAVVIDPSKVKNGILVMDDNPELYMQLGLPCATKYTNFSIAYFKIKAFAHNRDRNLFSRDETLADVYEAFSGDMPDYIIDPLNLVPSLKENIPLLFDKYVGDSAAGYRFYRLEK